MPGRFVFKTHDVLFLAWTFRPLKIADDGKKRTTAKMTVQTNGRRQRRRSFVLFVVRNF